MRKLFKNILICATATVMAAGSVTFAACDKKFTPLEGDDYKSTEAAVSNGGFAVEYGKYLYFINGVTTYEDDNTYGKPVKGALMRIAVDDFKNNRGEAQIVVPSLIVSGDYTAGFFIYNDRVYYATPNNVKSMSGEIERDWLDFKSASLNGSDVQSYFRLSSNTTVFRYVQVEGDETVYLLYNGKKPNDDNSTSGIQSYNTSTKTCTTIAEGASTPVFNSVDKTDPYVYYTMSVSDMIDSDSPQTLGYNQIYRARADVTKCPYTYTWDEDYLDEHDGVEPYVNLGTLVLDGVGKPTANSNDIGITQFTHDYKDDEGNVIAEPLTPNGYTYTLQSYSNSEAGDKSYSGIYFTRQVKTNNSSVGASLYYLEASDVDATGWNSISGNKDKITHKSDAEAKLDVVAKSTDTSKASSSALFYIDAQEVGYKHHYIYVEGNNMIRADVSTEDAGAETQDIWYDANGATLVRLDNREGKYNYVWFTRTNGSGMSVERAVYNGSAEDYEFPLDYAGKNKPYKAMKILDLQHKSSWYPYEMIEDMILFADAESMGSSYNYISAVSLTDKEGHYLNNQEFEEQINEKWNALWDSDDGYLQTIESSALKNALNYYFRTGKTDAFYDAIQGAVDLGKKETFLFTEDEQATFKLFTENGTLVKENKDGEEVELDNQFVDDDGNYYRTRSYFIHSIGKVSDADQEAIENYWSGYVKPSNYPAVTEADDALEDWELALAIVLPVVGAAAIAAVVSWLLLKKKREALEAPKPQRMRVDTNVDKNVDVYGNSSDSDEKDDN